MMHRAAPLSLLALSLLTATTPAAPEPPHPVVAGFERFHADGKADPAEGGRLLLGELNCAACHHADTPTPAPKQGPVLDTVGSRVRTSYIRKFLLDPQGIKPGTTMPHLLKDDPQAAEKAEALVHFLASTGSPGKEPARPRYVAAGHEHYHNLGCFACHGTRDALGKPDKVLPHSVPLGDLEAKYTIDGLAAFLKDPHAVRPSGRMPRLLQAGEARDVAHYLLQGVKVDLAAVKGVTRYAYYEGSWGNLPDFSKMEPAATGLAFGFDVEAARRANDYALKFEGYFKVERAGDYAFTTASDDGSRLYVDDRLVVDNDGTHATQSQSGSVKLTKGPHKVVVTYFQGPGEAVLKVNVQAPGFGDHDLASLVAPTPEALEKERPSAPPDPDDLDIRPDLAEKGKALFTSLGCASCHSLTAGGARLASPLEAPPLPRLTKPAGCLADAPRKGVPWYSLSAPQRKALTAALATPAKGETPVIARTLTAFNCYACHSREKVGGPDAELNALFRTAQPEMGDEGRVPPPLDGVGAKMNPDYLKNLLDAGSDDRPYMHARMPGFGDANVGHLVRAFAEADKLPAVAAVDFDEPPGRVKAMGRHLVGAKGFSCFKCHLFAGHKAEGVQGIDMVLMPKRLRREWFHAYVFDPQRIRPGTRMPSAFFEGKSLLDVLGGSPPAQIEAMWQYLQDGNEARPPLGLGSAPIVLEPTKGAILYRNFVAGAGTRAIAVGYPEKAHLAFDANDLRLALLWQGDFLDAARHWTDRGAGFEGPLGDDVLSLHPGAPFASLASPDAPWPGAPAKEQGYRFRGYRLTPDDRPTFLYSFGEVRVEDFPNAVKGESPSIRRELTLHAEKPPPSLHFRAAVGDKIEEAGGGWYRIDGYWKVKVEGGEPAVRKSGGKAELLVPVRFREGKARLVQTFAW